MSRIKVLKFGGTSMGSADAMKRVIDIVRKPQKGTRARAVVVSAMSGVTDELIRIARMAAKKDPRYKKHIDVLEKKHLDVVRTLVSKENRVRAEQSIAEMAKYLREAMAGISLVRQLTPAALDYVSSYGERLSAHILTEALNDRGVACEYLNARRIIVTDDSFGAASVDFPATERATKKYFHSHRKLQIVTGFIAATRDKKTTTLGRGGSDYSAAIIGAALGASAIEIWTDVSGIYSADPRIVKGARVVPELAFEEAGELAYFGAKVLHPKTIIPAMRADIPVRVLNTFKPQEAGTTIVANFAERRTKSVTVDAITFKRPVVIIHVHSPEFFDAVGLMSAIFSVFDTHRTSIDVVATSVTSVSLTIDNETHLRSIVRALGTLGKVSVERDKAIVCAVGGGINTAGVAGKMFTALGKSGVNVEMISQASSAVSITFLVPKRYAEKALKVLHKQYIGR